MKDTLLTFSVKCRLDCGILSPLTMTLKTMINGRHEAEGKTISKKKNQILHFRQGGTQELPKQKARPTKRLIEDTCSPMRNQKDSAFLFLSELSDSDMIKSVVSTRKSGQPQSPLSGQMFGPRRVFCGSREHPSIRALQLLCYTRNDLLSSGLAFNGSADQTFAATTLSQISSCAELSVKPLEPREHTKQSSHTPGKIVDRLSCRARGMPTDHHFEVSWTAMPVQCLKLAVLVLFYGTRRSRISSDNFLFVECPFHNHNRDEAWRGTAMFTPYLSSRWN